MTQWLVEEAAFTALEVWLSRPDLVEERREAERLQARHAELVRLREEMRGGVR